MFDEQFDTTTVPNFEFIRLFQIGDFKSHAGLPLKWKIECDAIDHTEWRALATMIMDYQKEPFRKAIGIPRGGIPFEKALKPYATLSKSDPLLICDDVYTTGTSMREVYEYGAIGVVVFARNKISDDWVKAIWTLSI